MWTLVSVMVKKDDKMGMITKLIDKDEGDNATLSEAFETATQEAEQSGFEIMKASARSAGGGASGGGNNPSQLITVGTVVRRIQTNSDATTTDVLDCYAVWNAAKSNARFRLTSYYLNTDSDREAFEQVSGLKVSDMPVFGDGAKISPMERNPNMPHKCEVELPKAVKAKMETRTKMKGGQPVQRDDGKGPVTYRVITEWLDS